MFGASASKNLLSWTLLSNILDLKCQDQIHSLKCGCSSSPLIFLDSVLKHSFSTQNHSHTVFIDLISNQTNPDQPIKCIINQCIVQNQKEKNHFSMTLYKNICQSPFLVYKNVSEPSMILHKSLFLKGPYQPTPTGICLRKLYVCEDVKVSKMKITSC